MTFALAVVLCSFVAKLHELTCDVLKDDILTLVPFCFIDNNN